MALLLRWYCFLQGGNVPGGSIYGGSFEDEAFIFEHISAGKP